MWNKTGRTLDDYINGVKKKNKKRMFKLYLYLVLFLLASCRVDTKSFLIEEAWGIQEIYFYDEDVKDDFMTNSLFFEEGNVCKIPFIHSVDMDKKDRIGTWSFNKETQKLTIKSKNPYLNGEFDICFEKNTEYKRIILVLTSDKVHLKATKGITTYHGKGGKLPILCSDKE